MGKRKPKLAASKEQWIRDTQMFQRIAGKPETSYEELSKEYDGLRKSNGKVGPQPPT